MAPRVSKAQSVSRLATKTLIVDNGANTMKAGFAPPQDTSADALTNCHIIPNCVARGYDAQHKPRYYVADELDACRDFESMGFKRPVEKGFLVNWDTEMDVWKQAFFRKGAKIEVDAHETNLIITESPNCPLALQSNLDQMIFEEFEFASAYRCTAPSLTAYNSIPALFGDPEPHRSPPANCLLVVDCGYSHTTISPLLDGKPIKQSVRRLDIGGKVLTNQLMELLSVRHYDLRAEPYQVTNIKEAISFVSQDFKHDLERTWKGTSSDLKKTNDLTLEYVLPDWHHSFQGIIRPYDPSVNMAQKLAARKSDPQAREKFAKLEDSFPLCNERFIVPELLFNPSDLGMQEAGLSEAIVQVLSTLPSGLWPGMLANILVVGGTARMPGLIERLETELRCLVPEDIPLRVRKPDDPVTYSWLGGAHLASDPLKFEPLVVTRQEYLEHGATWTTRQFNGQNR